MREAAIIGWRVHWRSWAEIGSWLRRHSISLCGNCRRQVAVGGSTDTVMHHAADSSVCPAHQSTAYCSPTNTTHDTSTAFTWRHWWHNLSCQHWHVTPPCSRLQKTASMTIIIITLSGCRTAFRLEWPGVRCVSSLPLPAYLASAASTLHPEWNPVRMRRL